MTEMLVTKGDLHCSKCKSKKISIEHISVIKRDDQLLSGEVIINCMKCEHRETVKMVEDSEKSHVERAYLFSELDDDVKDKVLKKHYDINMDFLSDQHRDTVEYMLEEAGLECDIKRTYWDYDRPFYFFSDDIWVADDKKFWESLKPEFKKFLDEIDPDNNLRDNGDVGFGMKLYGGGQGANHVNFETSNVPEPDDIDRDSKEYEKFEKDLEERGEKIDQILNEWWNDFYQTILYALRKEMEDEISDERITETIEINEYRFNLDGDIVR